MVSIIKWKNGYVSGQSGSELHLLPILIEYLIKDRIKGPARYPKRPTKIAITLVKFGPRHGWACLGIAKLKQIVNEKPKRNPETMTCFPSIPPSGTRSRPWIINETKLLVAR
jgi:hypothetical protein